MNPSRRINETEILAIGAVLREILGLRLFFLDFWTDGPKVDWRRMESTRDVRRLIEKEIKKGSAPLTFDRIEYQPNMVWEIPSESKLKDVLVYLLRTAEYEELANDMTRNNVYMENHLIRGDSFHRRNNVMERNANYLNIMGYAKRCCPEYDRKTFVEGVPCYYAVPDGEMEKYKFEYKGDQTYAFPLSGKHIINGLYLMSILHRKALANEEAPDFVELSEHRNIFHLTNIRKVIFQCLLLDDMCYTETGFEAKLYTVYLME